MDGEMEIYDSLAAMEIIAEALKILHLGAKLFGSIAFTLLMPLSFAILLHKVISQPFLSKIAIYDALLDANLFSPAAESIRHNLRVQILELFLLTAVFITLVWGFSLLSTSAVVYTVASTYAGKELSYALVLSALPRVWKRIMHTFLWFLLIVFVYFAGTVCALSFWLFIGGIVGLNRETLVIGFIGIATVAVAFHVYIAMVWQVASVVCVVEERCGLAAMEKSKRLIKGNWVTALALNLLYMMVMGDIVGIQSYLVYGEGMQGMSVGVIVIVVLQCGVDLVWLLTHFVLYFVCKSCQSEDVDKAALSNHLEMYHGGYMLLKDGSFQLEKFGP